MGCQRNVQLASFVLPDLSGTPVDTSKLPGKIRVFVFFSPLDCQPCLNEVELWEQVSREFLPTEISVVGVGNTEHPNMLLAFQQARQFSFTILYDAERHKTAELKIMETPVRLICDRKGRVLHQSHGAVQWLRRDKVIPFCGNLSKTISRCIATK
ncbi:MAG: TlpA family protein disulfide reductase [candidate division KSB1 bacterium]|nr:TlpA family protein disulfide reductase [candidate division KSB1 bacterium]MDZ7368226.1 TlpA family protein disulfide reductase [candidate division KSB1 bacterium]